TVRRVFTKLEKSGFIITGNYNKDPRDKTKWYTINDEKLEELYFEVEDRKKRLENEKLKENGFEATPNAFSQNDQMEDVKMTKCIESNCINLFSQNDQMQLCEMNKPLP
ncbi:MAG TPA: conjugal transfer protein, partial [Candidatus Dwaynia gallinarum]|nr:conjugal transfer protein [Candidatus Dwaynia gallinarum]